MRRKQFRCQRMNTFLIAKVNEQDIMKALEDNNNVHG